MPRTNLMSAAVLMAVVLSATGRAAPPVLFEGFGFGSFEESGSIAAELRRIEAEAERERLVRMPEVAVARQGSVGRDVPPVPLSAELRSTVAQFDVAAGMVADSEIVVAGPARWTGRIGLASDRAEGGESVELRTVIGNNAEWGLVGLELGPRMERRLRKGATFFIDGKAEARAMRSAETGWWSLPGTSTDGSSMVGVMARTGLVH